MLDQLRRYYQICQERYFPFVQDAWHRQEKVVRAGFLFLFALIAVGSLMHKSQSGSKGREAMLLATARVRSFTVDVRTVGELEASRSTSIGSAIRGDQGKIIQLINDGLYVQPGDLLIKLDPTPFEQRVEELSSKIKEQEANLYGLRQQLEWDSQQIALEQKTVAFELESAEMELEKIKHGDGPQEIAKLKSAMLKAQSKYEETSEYAEQVDQLGKEGFLNPTEVKLAKKKFEEEKQAYEDAKKQYETYLVYVLPMQIKKAETALKRATIKQEESSKSGKFKKEKAYNNVVQAQQNVMDLQRQLVQAKSELSETEIRAPGQGMVVHREGYRQGQMRKPRLGDVVMRNQPILDLPDLTSMMVRTKVREVDLFKVQVGQGATVHVDAYPDISFRGTVSAIGVLALSDHRASGEEKFFEVRINLEDADARLRPGMTTRVTVHADQVDSQVTLPIDAVFAQEGENYCYLKTRRGYKKQPVKVGTSNDEFVEVAGGIGDGQRVCLVKPKAIL